MTKVLTQHEKFSTKMFPETFRVIPPKISTNGDKSVTNGGLHISPNVAKNIQEKFSKNKFPGRFRADSSGSASSNEKFIDTKFPGKFRVTPKGSPVENGKKFADTQFPGKFRVSSQGSSEGDSSSSSKLPPQYKVKLNGLVKNFNTHPRANMTKIDSVQKWLQDLRFMTEPECMSVLQGKSISGNNTSVEPMVAAAKSNKDSIDAIRSRAAVISVEFAKVFKKIEKERWKHLKSASVRITSHMRSLLHEINTCIHDMPPYLFEEEAAIMEECAKLSQYLESMGETNGHKLSTTPIVNSLTELGKSFSTVVDMALGYLVQSMVQTVDESNSAYCVQSTISHIISLGLEGEHMCYLIAREGGVKTLFDLCRDDSMSQTHCQALRGIATISCVSESISALEKTGGVECLTDILCNISLGESMRSEAAGVIAQITSPSMNHYQHIMGFIENLDDLIRALLNLCVQASTHEVFLLATAAIANITFMDSMAVDCLSSYNAAKIIVAACSMNKAESVFAKDQVATILANMSVLDASVSEIKDNNGIQLLLSYLQQRPLQNSDAEIAASERVLQKTAIAVTRLCRAPENASIIVQNKGVPLLVNLCRNIKARNNSDGVLIASLAALRKISSLIGPECLDVLDVQQLIKPTLIDSYLICSQMEESFV